VNQSNPLGCFIAGLMDLDVENWFLLNLNQTHTTRMLSLIGETVILTLANQTKVAHFAENINATTEAYDKCLLRITETFELPSEMSDKEKEIINEMICSLLVDPKYILPNGWTQVN
jgi:hypothetical protein